MVILSLPKAKKSKSKVLFLGDEEIISEISSVGSSRIVGGAEALDKLTNAIKDQAFSPSLAPEEDETDK